MEENSRRFLKKWVLTGAALLALIVTFNVVINPYMVLEVPRIAGFNARKPSIETHAHLIKAYDVLRVASRTVLLGTSTVALGIDANDVAWPAQIRPVYNLSIRGGGPYTSLRYLQHVAVRRDLKLVIMGLDFNFFLNVPDPLNLDSAFESRLTVQADGKVNSSQVWQQVSDILQATMSLDTVKDSVVTLAANLRGESPDVTSGNWENSDYFRFAMERRGRWMAFWDRRVIDLYKGKQINSAAMEAVKAVIRLCQERGIQIVLFISPIHADEMEAIDLDGSWKIYEDWKRELVSLVSEHSQGGSNSTVTLWDFSEYDSYSTETPTDDAVMHWFRDSSHYSRELGKLIVRRILGDGDTHFGTLLSPETLEAHLVEIRRQQCTYRLDKPLDSLRVRDLYRSMYPTER